MEAQIEKVAKAVKKNPNFAQIRVRKETRKKIIQDLTKINKKDFGKRVTADQYLALAVSRIEPKDLVALQEGSLTYSDRLELDYREYIAKNGVSLTKDEYLGKRLSHQIEDPRTESTISHSENKE